MVSELWRTHPALSSCHVPLLHGTTSLCEVKIQGRETFARPGHQFKSTDGFIFRIVEVRRHVTEKEQEILFISLTNVLVELEQGDNRDLVPSYRKVNVEESNFCGLQLPGRRRMQRWSLMISFPGKMIRFYITAHTPPPKKSISPVFLKKY